MTVKELIEELSQYPEDTVVGLEEYSPYEGPSWSPVKSLSYIDWEKILTLFPS